MNLSGNSFFNNSDFEFCSGEASEEESNEEDEENNMAISYWNPNVTVNHCLGGVLKVYANDLLPEASIEFSYSLLESTQSQLDYQKRGAEPEEFVSLSQSYRRFTGFDNSVGRSRLNTFVNKKIKVVPARSVNPHVNFIKTFFTRKTQQFMNAASIVDRDEFSNQDSRNLTLDRSASDANSDGRILPHNLTNDTRSVGIASEQVPLVPNSLQQNFGLNQSIPIEREVYRKSAVLFNLKSPVDRSCLLLIPFRIRFRNRTLPPSVSERFDFKKRGANLQAPSHSQIEQFFTINIAHRVSFSMKRSRPDAKDSAKKELSAVHDFTMYPASENLGSTSKTIEKDVEVRNGISWWRWLFRRPKTVRITVYLDRTILIRNNYSANLTVSYHKDILNSYKLLQFIIYQSYQSKEKDEHYKEVEILSDEIDMVNKFTSDSMPILEFVHRIPFEKAARRNMQTVEVNLKGFA